uniref:Uncharacterized protein n=1 Tax=Enterovibrio norvegicus TaxID=188144 RepID=A0A0H3ZX68_9GAMM|nr:hypothetical protein [Enterovibrio norvegicus]
MTARNWREYHDSRYGKTVSDNVTHYTSLLCRTAFVSFQRRCVAYSVAQHRAPRLGKGLINKEARMTNGDQTAPLTMTVPRLMRVADCF